MLLAIPASMNAWTTCHQGPLVFSPARTFHFSEGLQVAAAIRQTAWSVWRRPPAVPGVVHEAHGGEPCQPVAQVPGAFWAGLGGRRCVCAIIRPVKHARPPLVPYGKPGTGGTSGLHRTAQQLTAAHREVRIRATETSRGVTRHRRCSMGASASWPGWRKPDGYRRKPGNPVATRGAERAPGETGNLCAQQYQVGQR